MPNDRLTRVYALVTLGYWAFTVTDGALRMLVLLHFHDLGYSPVAIAFLFLAYEAMGVVTNLLGGWVGARTGLHRTLLAGLALQIAALLLLSIQQTSWREWVSVIFVMAVQALSGIAKDLTKMSSKSAVKLVAGSGEGALFRLVAMLTGSKNALKGFGFFLGGLLLTWLGFDGALAAMAAGLGLTLLVVMAGVGDDLGSTDRTTSLTSLLSASEAINRLSAARLFLFGARDIWFVVALPVFLDDQLGWSNTGIGAFLAAWVIGYGAIQSAAPRILRTVSGSTGSGSTDTVAAAKRWIVGLAAVAAVIAAAVSADLAVPVVVVGGLVVFGALFAVNSSLHSYLILAYTDRHVALDVGFYYAANAAGRLIGTLLSGVLAVIGGLALSMWGTTAFLAIAWFLSRSLPPVSEPVPA
jgi:hypothetical protein